MINSRHRKNLKGLALKSLSLAALVGVMSIGGAHATTINDVDMTQIPLDTPTLDYLNKNNIYMLPKLDSNGNIISGTENILYPKSGYTLTEVKNADPENLPANTITKYELTDVTKYYHPETGAEVASNALEVGVEYKQVTVPQANPKYYTVGLKQTEYGTKDGATDVKYFNWGKDANGCSVLTEGASILKANDITYYIKKSTSELATERITTNLNGADLNKTFISMNSSLLGGAVYNDGTIGNITGKFIGNYVQTNEKNISAYGGAIYNKGIIGDITADFIGNYVTSKQFTAYGGAIASYAQNSSTATIGNITGNFINNNSDDYGGAIYNYANDNSNIQIGNITGDFIGNYVKSGHGSAIYSYANDNSNIQIGNITGNFINNNNSFRGAIYNYAYDNSTAQIGNITGDFINNNSYDYGGAIYNEAQYSSTATIGNITGDFINNSVAKLAYGFGGAIYNGFNSQIGDIIGNFVSNKATMGGAIFNYGTIEDITGDFTSNSILSYTAEGGAIYNDGTIDVIKGDFISNSAKSTSGGVYGGAIYNSGTVASIIGDFVGNSAANSYGGGGAIYNFGTINSLKSDFIGNFALNDNVNGGAILNGGTIGDITGDFIGNYAKSNSYHIKGGAIDNVGTIGDITGSFVNNYVQADTDAARGGAIYNYMNGYNYAAQIGDITGDFIGNYAQANSGSSSGGAIYNYAYDNSTAQIGNITGDFIGNYAQTTSGFALGGAIYNYSNGYDYAAQIGDITGDFIGNYAKSNSYHVYGGAIYNDGTVGNITGDFIDNYVQADEYAKGGAIYNNGIVTSIIGDFKNNSAISTYGGYGGAIYNAGTINSLKSDFIGNYVQANSGPSYGGAIYNYAESYSTTQIGDITGNFVDNHAGAGGAIYNEAQYRSTATIGNITGDFIGNYAQANSGPSHGGAIYNYACSNSTAQIGDITGDFIGNYAQANSGYAFGGAIYNGGYSQIGDITGNFVNNYVQAGYGGAIYNDGIIASIIGDFKNNAILYSANGSSTYAGGAVYNSGAIDLLKSDFIENGIKLLNTSSSNSGILAKGGAIYNNGTISEIQNSSFIGNFAIAPEGGQALGGAIYSEKDLNIVADNGISQFSGNYVQVGDGEKDYQALYLAQTINSSYSTRYNVNDLTLEAKNNGVIVFDDKIVTESNVVTNYGAWFWNPDLQKAEFFYVDEYGNKITSPALLDIENSKIDFKGDRSGVIQINNDIKALNAQTKEKGEADLNLYLVTLHLGARDNVLDGNNLTMHSGTLNMINNQAGVSALNNLKVAGDTVMHVDVDLENKVMDRFTADSYGDHGGNVTVSGMNLLSDANQNENLTAVYFAQPGLKNNVINGVGGGTGDLPDSNYQTEVYTPIYKYNVAYDNVNQYDGKGDGGYFLFAKGDRIIQQTPSGGFVDGGSTGNMSDAFNPAVLGSSAMAAVGATATMGNVMRYSYQNAENFMNMPYFDRMAYKDKNKYALSPTGDATDFGTFSPLFQNNRDSGSGWFKPYASFENVALKNGPKVSNITYGSLLGFDTDIKSLKGGWDRTFTGYIGYHGASQRYSGVDSYQNGGLIGGTMTMFKGNFFNATTLSVGASVASNSTMYGNDNYTMLLGGIGNKTGYNIELREGKLIFQPSMIVSYTWVNTFDYTNAAGVKIENDPLHAIQLAPGAKLIANTKNGWQPYIGVNMVWNLMGKTDATANGVRLPAMSIKPFVQYGVGVQRRFCDHMMGFGQVMLHSGGRNGVSLNFGFRWALGSDCDCHNNNGKKLWKFARKNKEVEAQPYDMMYRGNQQFGLYSRKVIKQMASVERTKAMK